MAADKSTDNKTAYATEVFASHVVPSDVPCPLKICSAPVGDPCKRGFRFHDERWRAAISAVAGAFIEPLILPGGIPSLGLVLETLDANKEATLPELITALDALGNWHPVIDNAHAVGEWRWVLSLHPKRS